MKQETAQIARKYFVCLFRTNPFCFNFFSSDFNSTKRNTYIIGQTRTYFDDSLLVTSSQYPKYIIPCQSCQKTLEQRDKQQRKVPLLVVHISSNFLLRESHFANGYWLETHQLLNLEKDRKATPKARIIIQSAKEHCINYSMDITIPQIVLCYIRTNHLRTTRLKLPYNKSRPSLEQVQPQNFLHT